MASDKEMVGNLSGKINEFYKTKGWDMSHYESGLRDKAETIGDLQERV